MTAHDEDQEKDLGGTEDFSAYPPSHDFTCVGHVVDVGVSKFELTNYVAGIGRDDAETYDQDNTAGEEVSGEPPWPLGDETYGTMPMEARTEGRERMPRDMVSAIMTADISVKYALWQSQAWIAYSCLLACEDAVSRLIGINTGRCY